MASRGQAWRWLITMKQHQRFELAAVFHVLMVMFEYKERFLLYSYRL